MDPITHFIVNHVVDWLAAIIMPVMFLTFTVAVVFRCLIFYTAKAEANFSKEFEKRVYRYFQENPQDRIPSFYKLLKVTLERTFYEIFELRNKYKRRSLDYVMGITDRVFLIQDGVVRLILDLLKQSRYFRRDASTPKMMEATRGAFENNPVFTKLMGLFPLSLLNELLNILPNLFIIGGIFGTFLGISKGLPELSGMDLGQIDQTKHVMDQFLVSISQAMVKSIVGIALSVAMSLINTVLAPEALYYHLVNRFAATMEQLWNETSTNEIDPADLMLEPNKVALKKDQRAVKDDTQSGGKAA